MMPKLPAKIGALVGKGWAQTWTWLESWQKCGLQGGNWEGQPDHPPWALYVWPPRLGVPQGPSPRLGCLEVVGAPGSGACRGGGV
jgi:hypothetical protein